MPKKAHINAKSPVWVSLSVGGHETAVVCIFILYIKDWGARPRNVDENINVDSHRTNNRFYSFKGLLRSYFRPCLSIQGGLLQKKWKKITTESEQIKGWQCVENIALIIQWVRLVLTTLLRMYLETSALLPSTGVSMPTTDALQCICAGRCVWRKCLC